MIHYSNREIAAKLRLYLATDDALFAGREPVKQIIRAVEGGVTAVQLRLKSTPDTVAYETGRHLLEVLRPLGVPLIINDRVDIMLALNADGVHVGRGDLPLPEVRKLAGPKIVGYSANSVQDIHLAERQGANYAGVGPIFATDTKADTGPVLGLDGLAEIVKASPLPCVAIGGISQANIGSVAATGVVGCCVISAILRTADPFKAAADLKKKLPARLE